MYREIGEQFYINNTKYEIVKSNINYCESCCFTAITCYKLKEIIGFCSSQFRKDHNNICVKEIKE